MKTMTCTKLNRAAGMGMVALLAVGTATLGVSQTNAGDGLTGQDIAAKTRDAYAALSSYSDNGQIVSEMSGRKTKLNFDTRLQRPNLYRIDWTQWTGLKGAVWSDGSGNYLQVEAGSPPTPGALAAISACGLKNDPSPQKMESMNQALAKASGISYSAASTIPGAFFGRNVGDVFIYPAISGRYPLQREKDGQVNDTDCYVVSTAMDLSKVPDAGKSGIVHATLWIGKTDFLVHQTRTRYMEKVDENALSSDQAVDEAIKKSLEMQNKPVTPEAIAAMRPQMRAIMKQVQSTLKAGFKAGVVFTQTHQNIAVNQTYSPSDFLSPQK